MTPLSPMAKRMAVTALFVLPFPIAWALYFFYRTDDALPSICFYHVVTGRPCIFCGLTHAFAYATHGEWAQAFQCHLLWPLPFALLMGLGVANLFCRDLPRRLARLIGNHFKIILFIIVLGTLLRACG